MQVKAVLCAALYPNVAVMDDSAGKTARPAWNDGNATVFIHPSSINHALDAHQFLRPYLMYLEKVGCCPQTCCYEWLVIRMGPRSAFKKVRQCIIAMPGDLRAQNEWDASLFAPQALLDMGRTLREESHLTSSKN